MDIPDDPSWAEYDSLADGPLPERRGLWATIVNVLEAAVVLVLVIGVWLTALDDPGRPAPGLGPDVPTGRHHTRRHSIPSDE